MMQRNVVAKQRVWPERNMVDAHQVGDVFEMLHERFNVVVRMVLREGGVRRRLDADDATLIRTRLEDVVWLHAPCIPERARTNVGDENGLLADFDGVQ